MLTRFIILLNILMSFTAYADVIEPRERAFVAPSFNPDIDTSSPETFSDTGFSSPSFRALTSAGSSLINDPQALRRAVSSIELKNSKIVVKTCPEIPCARDKLPGSTDGTDEFSDMFKVPNCSCNGNDPTSFRSTELENLARICQCMRLKSNSIAGFIMGQKDDSDLASELQIAQKKTIDGIQGVLSYMSFGSEAQALYIGATALYNSDDPIWTQQVNVIARETQQNATSLGAAVVASTVPITNTSDQAFSEDLNTELRSGVPGVQSTSSIIKKPVRAEFAALMEKNRSTLSAEHCLSMQDYLSFKQTPRSHDFYRDLASVTTGPGGNFDPKDWNLENLSQQLSDAVNAQRLQNPDADPAVSRIKARMKFLLGNPLYAGFLASDATVPEKENLMKRIQTSFNCASGEEKLRYPWKCAFETQRKRNDSDKAFFSDEKNAERVRNGMLNSSSVFVASVAKESSLYASRIPLPSETLRYYPGQPFVSEPSVVEVKSSCDRVDAIQLQAEANPTSLNAKPGEDFRADFIASLGREFNPDSSVNEPFKDFQKRACSETRCPVGQDGCTSGRVSFMEYAASREKNCAANDDGCWRDLQKDYFKRYEANPQGGFGDWDIRNFAAYARTGGSRNVTAENFAKFYRAQRQISAQTQVAAASVDPTTGRVRILSDSNGQTIRRSTRSSSSSSSATSAIVAPDALAPRIAERTLTPSTNQLSAPVAGPSSSQDFAAYYNIPASAAVPAAAKEAVVRDIQSNRDQAASLTDQATALASAAIATPDLTERRRLEALIAEISAKADAADRNSKLLTERLAEAEARASGKVTSRTRRPASAEDPEDDSDSQNGTTSSRTTSSTGGTTINPQLNPQQSLATPASSQSYGSGGSSYSLPPLTLPKVRGAAGRSGAVNFSFKYGTDAKQGTTGGPGIIVAGTSSAFESSESFAAAVNESEKVDIGSVSGTEASLLTARNPDAIEKYRQQIKDAPGSLVRLSFTTPNGVSEIIVAKNADGTFFVPAVRNLARARLAAMKAILPAGI